MYENITLEDLYEMHEKLSIDIEVSNGVLNARYNDYDEDEED